MKDFCKYVNLIKLEGEIKPLEVVDIKNFVKFLKLFNNDFEIDYVTANSADDGILELRKASELLEFLNHEIKNYGYCPVTIYTKDMKKVLVYFSNIEDWLKGLKNFGYNPRVIGQQ